MKLYQYFGHSSDYCDEKGTMYITEVPKGSMYINKTGCGLINYMNGAKFAELFIDPELKRATRDPVRHTDSLAKFCESDIVIHKAGDDFVEAIYYPLAIFPMRRGEFLLFLSGMRDSEYFSKMTPQTNQIKYLRYQPGEMVLQKTIVEVFSGALYPTQAMVKKVFTKSEYSYEQLQVLGKELQIPILRLIQEKYVSDIRSMLNYMQLTGQTNEEENSTILDERVEFEIIFTNMIQKKIKICANRFNEITIKYNKDNQTLWKQYFMFLLVVKSENIMITSPFLKMMEKIIASSNEHYSIVFTEYYFSSIIQYVIK